MEGQAVVFVVRIVGSGLFALPVLAGSTADAVAEVFDWPEESGLKVRSGTQAVALRFIRRPPIPRWYRLWE